MATKILEVADVSVIRAAGGVVLRKARSGETEIAIIHRPAYDDWTLPKGKIEPDESPEDCALREVREETGLRCELLRPLGCTAYVDRRGRAEAPAPGRRIRRLHEEASLSEEPAPTGGSHGSRRTP